MRNYFGFHEQALNIKNFSKNTYIKKQQNDFLYHLGKRIMNKNYLMTILILSFGFYYSLVGEVVYFT